MVGKSVDSVEDLIENLIRQKGIGQKMQESSFSLSEIKDGARGFLKREGCDLNVLERFLEVISRNRCQTVEEAAECAALGISDYQVHKKLGEGVYKKVYLGVNTFSAEEKALKIVEISARGEANLKNKGINMKTFVHEEAAKSVRVKKINNPHLVTVEDIRYESGPGKFVIYEELLDETLSEARQRSKETRSTDLWKERVVLYAAQIAAGLSALHEHNLIHGDLTLSNIGIKDGKVKITDFGLASTLGNLAQEVGERANVGSILTRAPELFSGQPPTDKSDVWSFGVVVYALTAGAYPPFLSEGEHPQEPGEKRMAFEKEVKKRIDETDLGSLYAAFSGRIKHTLKACLQKEPQQRRPMAEIYDSLRKWYIPFQIHYSEECNQWVGDWKKEWQQGRPSPVPASELWFLPFSRERIGGYRVIFVIDQGGEILCYDGENSGTLSYRSEQPHYLLGTFESPSFGHALRCFMVRSRRWKELDVYNESHRSIIGPTRSLIFSHPRHREMLEDYLVDVDEILADQI